VLAMNRVLAGALLLAVAGAVFQSLLPEASAAVRSSEYAHAVSRALWPAIAVQGAGTLLTWMLVRAPSSSPEPAADVAQYHQHHRRFHL
jgi:hypothetical protein